MVAGLNKSSDILHLFAELLNYIMAATNCSNNIL